MTPLTKLTPRERVNLWALTALLSAGLAVLLVCHSLSLPLSADEQPYIAAGAVGARQGQWPVRDYAYFDMPALAVMYAGLFRVSDDLLPTARLSSAAAGALAAILLFAAAVRRLDAITTLGRFGLAAGAAVLLVTCPLFLQVTGRAMPHDFAAVAALGGMLASMGAIRTASSRKAAAFAVVAGLCVGTAVSLRVLYAPLVIVMLLMLPMTPGATPGRRMGAALAAAVAVAAAWAPTYVLLRKTPDVLWFATADLPFAQWRQSGSFSWSQSFASESQRAMLRQLVVEPSTLVLLLALGGLAVLTIVVAARAASENRPRHLMIEIAAAMTATATTAMMAHLCTPASQLHLFAAVPLAVLTCVLCAAYLRQHGGERARVVATTLYVGAVLGVLVPGVQQWSGDLRRFDYDQTPVGEHLAEARQLRMTVQQRHVLTLHPLTALEAGGRVYPALILGEATWKWASSVSDEQRERLGLITPVQMGALVKAYPPAAVMIRESPTRAELPLMSYARYHGFRKQPMPSGVALWVTETAPPTAYVASPRP